MATLLVYGWPTAAALAPFILVVGLSPFLLRKRLDRLGSRAREVLGLLNAHAVDTIQGLTELLAFGQQAARRAVFLGFVRDHHRVRLPYYRDLTLQMSLIETATGLGGLAVVMAGTAWIAAGWLEAAMLPLLAILAMATFLPVSEIATSAASLPTRWARRGACMPCTARRSGWRTVPAPALRRTRRRWR